MSRLRNFLRMFDYFRYIPQFRINGNASHSSTFGGIISILFILLSIGYFLFQTFLFLNHRDKVITCMISTKPAENQYNLTTKDIYLGIGLVDINQKELNISDYPYLKFYLNFVILDDINRLSNQISLEQCNFSLLINQQDIENMNSQDIVLTKSRIPYYLCPVANSTFNIIPDTF